MRCSQVEIVAIVSRWSESKIPLQFNYVGREKPMHVVRFSPHTRASRSYSLP